MRLLKKGPEGLTHAGLQGKYKETHKDIVLIVGRIKIDDWAPE